MFIRLKHRVIPIVLLTLSSIWLALFFCPLFFYLLFPNKDIQDLLAGLEGRVVLTQELQPIQQTILARGGHLKRAIPVAASYLRGLEYGEASPTGNLRTSKTAQVSFLAWFENSPQPTALTITRTQWDDGSPVHFNVNALASVRVLRLYRYLYPVVALVFSLCFYRKRNRFLGEPLEPLEPYHSTKPLQASETIAASEKG